MKNALMQIYISDGGSSAVRAVDEMMKVNGVLSEMPGSFLKSSPTPDYPGGYKMRMEWMLKTSEVEDMNIWLPEKSLHPTNIHYLAYNLANSTHKISVYTESVYFIQGVKNAIAQFPGIEQWIHVHYFKKDQTIEVSTFDKFKAPFWLQLLY